MLYFIRSGRYIKIGVSANPWVRMSEFQTASPEPLEMLCIAPGDYAFESELHKLFARHHHSNEWFCDNDQLREFIQFMRGFFPSLQQRPEVTRVEPVKERPPKVTRTKETKTGWIEYPRRGTRNPKRYPSYREWIKDDSGQWKKSPMKRIESARPLTEQEYQEYRRTGLFPAGVTIEV